MSRVALDPSVPLILRQSQMIRFDEVDEAYANGLISEDQARYAKRIAQRDFLQAVVLWVHCCRALAGEPFDED